MEGKRSAPRAVIAYLRLIVRPMLTAGPTPGNAADIATVVPLLETVNPPRRLDADLACDADRLRRVTAVIPPTASRRTP